MRSRFSGQTSQQSSKRPSIIDEEGEELLINDSERYTTQGMPDKDESSSEQGTVEIKLTFSKPPDKTHDESDEDDEDTNMT